LPALRTGTTPTPAAYATAAAITNPRASIPTTTSKPAGRWVPTIPSTTSWKT
jgi:hypothetical protein